jgi:hypothetical protein
MEWTLIPHGKPDLNPQKSGILWGFFLLIQGKLMGYAIGEQEYYSNNPTMTWGDACEGAKSNALMRLCKGVGIGLELWKSSFLDPWKKKHAERYEYVNSRGETKKGWRKSEGDVTTTTPKAKPGPKPQVEKSKAESVAAKPTPKPAPTVSHEAPKPVKDEFTFGPEVGGDPPEWKAKAEPAPAAEEEFPQVTPPPAPTPLLKVDSPGATMAQMEKFAKIKVSLDALGINEETLWKGIHRFSERTFKRIVVEASEFTPPEMDYILGYMDRWVKAMEGEKVARAAAEKRRQGGQS